MRHPQLTAILTELRRGLDALYGDRLAHVLLFGSQARGDAEPYSDIDVLIVLYGEVDRVTEETRMSDLIWELSYRHDTVLTALVMSSDRYARQDSSLIQNIQHDGLAV